MNMTETVMHLMLECTRYERERVEMLNVVAREVESDAGISGGEVERTKRGWMLLLLGLSGRETEFMMKAVKDYLEKVWFIRSRT